MSKGSFKIQQVIQSYKYKKKRSRHVNKYLNKYELVLSTALNSNDKNNYMFLMKRKLKIIFKTKQSLIFPSENESQVISGFNVYGTKLYFVANFISFYLFSGGSPTKEIKKCKES